MNYQGPNQEQLILEEITSQNCQVLEKPVASSQTLIWFKSESIFVIDGKQEIFQPNQILCLTEFHHLHVKSMGKARMVRFNRPFYCVLDHDSEVGCKGILFFGSSQVPVLTLDANGIDQFETLWKVFVSEINSQDNLQQEMLQMILKRLLILCTRLYKEQSDLKNLTSFDSDLVREFNFLVEKHFKKIHTVKEYAELLNKSPKTLANLFSKMSSKTPLSYIHDRIMLEAKRLLFYTDKPIKEIGYELGFEDIQSFSRFFKKNEGKSPSEFKAELV
ncbi:helix-turn-helix domain-containing protein [Algoriphagus algorifonticola]|uniref:helix-turn-helix domain-containing protein n=1 Tax=Algoriphagus algorifonticola TaxID=2593007 RepID=UPI0011A9A1F8|nr:helix-turn-helix domain-containing protein [Algoriphagus algorifonticola]